VRVRTARVNAVLGSELEDAQVVGYLEPIGFTCVPESAGVVEVTVPTFRPDTGREIDVIEEVARHHGYANLPRRRTSAPQVGWLTPYQRDRRQARQVMAGLGAHEAWTASLLGPDQQSRVGIAGGVRVTNPLTPEESVLRQSLLPGMLGALAFNADRRQGEVRLFEVGHVFPPPDRDRVREALARAGTTVIKERDVLGVALAGEGDDARSAALAWQVLADAFGIVDVELVAPDAGAGADVASVPAGLHPTRCARLVVSGAGGAHGAVLGVVGEVDPAVLEEFGLDATQRRVGWLEVDLEALLNEAPRRSILVSPVSRFPSSDVDLAFVVDEAIPAAAVEKTVRQAGGELLEALALFDVYRGAGVPAGTRSLAYRLRLCAPDRTLTDQEVAGVRARCIAAVEQAHGARLRG
jgi:phenylalanyl-tRNA synthetase beta chain